MLLLPSKLGQVQIFLRISLGLRPRNICTCPHLDGRNIPSYQQYVNIYYTVYSVHSLIKITDPSPHSRIIIIILSHTGKHCISIRGAYFWKTSFYMTHLLILFLGFENIHEVLKYSDNLFTKKQSDQFKTSWILSLYPNKKIKRCAIKI